jgi:hypothetical protein
VLSGSAHSVPGVHVTEHLNRILFAAWRERFCDVMISCGGD